VKPKPDDLVKANHLFDGWNTAADGEGDDYEPGDTFDISGSIILYAKWAPSFTITYNANTGTGTVPAASTHKDGDTATAADKPADLVKADYLFKGWQTGPENGEFYAAGGTIPAQSNDLALYAKWAASYTVTYNANSADSETVPLPSTQEDNAPFTPVDKPAGLVKANHVFGGWQGETNGGDSYPVGTAIEGQAENFTLYAKWVPLNVNSTDELDDAIAAVKNRPVAEGPYTIQLTSTFYTTVNTAGNPIVIDPAAANADNTTPYIIEGLGKDSTDKLTVGILLANDNVTLDGVKINITDVTKMVTTGSSGNTGYRAAVSITRAFLSAGVVNVLIENNQANNYVTVKNCDITFAGDCGNKMIAGIFVSGDSSGPYTPSSDITLINNKVTVNNTGNTATQAITFRNTGSSFILEDNELSSTNVGTGTQDRPSSGILLSIQQGEFTSKPKILNNRFKGKEFDFYINLCSKGNRTGDSFLFNADFGTANSTWAVSNTSDQNDLNKWLLNTLLEQAAGPALGGNGAATFGRFAQFLGPTAGVASGSFALEYYEIDGGNITAVNYWSPGIAEGTTVYADGGPTQEASSDTNGVRGRLALQEGGGFSAAGKFKWTRTDETGTNLPPL
jgi:uncharacterized repeat protein (TIGR02543 family)